MPKYIHSNINATYTYTNTDVVSMYMYIYIYIHVYIYIYIIWIERICDFELDFDFQYSESQKWQSAVVTVKNENNQWSKCEPDSRYLEYECNNRIDDLLFLLPFCKKNIVVCFINQRYETFYLGKVCYLIFYTEMMWSRHL